MFDIQIAEMWFGGGCSVFVCVAWLEMSAYDVSYLLAFPLYT